MRQHDWMICILRYAIKSETIFREHGTCPDNKTDARGMTIGRCLVPADDSVPHLANPHLNLPSVASGNGSSVKFKDLHGLTTTHHINGMYYAASNCVPAET
ncbi:hypothetical protein HN011_001975 [Eciton burchellii]|nr:hypothetical protein HN011_001975 [Eciton burchellii]